MPLICLSDDCVHFPWFSLSSYVFFLYEHHDVVCCPQTQVSPSPCEWGRVPALLALQLPGLGPGQLRMELAVPVLAAVAAPGPSPSSHVSSQRLRSQLSLKITWIFHYGLNRMAWIARFHQWELICLRKETKCIEFWGKMTSWPVTHSISDKTF